MIKFDNHFKKRRYLNTIVIWVSAVVLLVVLVLTSAVYYNAQSILLKTKYEADKKILNQITYNIDFMDETISNITKYLYMNSDVTAIMYSNIEDMVDISVRTNKITSAFISISPYIHSIEIYNSNLNQIYNMGASLFFQDELLSDLANSKKIVPKLKPISRKIKKLINGKNEYENVFSYFMYDISYYTEKPESAIVVNIWPGWLLDNIKQINMVDDENIDSVFVLDQNDEFIQDGSENLEISKWLKTEYKKYKNSSTTVDSVGFFESKYNNIMNMVTYVYIESVGMTLLKIQPMAEAYRYINSLKSSVIIIAGIFLVMALALSLSVSRRIYRPFHELVKAITSYSKTKQIEVIYKDELSFLDAFYKQSIEKLHIYSEQRFQNRNVLKAYWLNRLLTESYSVDKAVLEEVFKEEKVSLQLDTDFCVCVLKIDKNQEMHKKNGSNGIEILRFAAINICSEVVAKSYINEGIDMKSDNVVLIINVPINIDNYLENITRHIMEAQKYIKQYFAISVTASVSRKTDDLKKISLLYNEALDNSVYRFVFGCSSIITPDNIRCNVENTKADYSKECENKLIVSIRSGKEKDMVVSLKMIFNEISELGYLNVIISLIRLTSTIKETLEETIRGRDLSSCIDFTSIHRSIIEDELSEIYNKMCEILLHYLKYELNHEMNSKNLYVVDAVMEYINNSYSDKSLCLAQIANMLKISPRLLSKIFRDSADISIPDHINEVRLVKAAELLSNKELNVYKVVEKVGIENESYFYSMFKKRFGYTPKEYALQTNIQNVKKE